MESVAALPFFRPGPFRPIPGAEHIQLHAFGFLVGLGVVVGLAMGTWRGQRKLGISNDRSQVFGIWVVAVGWMFAHVLNLVMYRPGLVVDRPALLFKFWGSVSSYGGLVGAILAVLVWHKFQPDRDLLVWADHAIWMSAFGWLFGRLGCTAAHDHLGARAAESWPLALEIPERLGGGFRHDLGFYEFLWWVVIVGAMLLIDRTPRRRGIYAVVVPILYAPVRFVLDFLRLWPVPKGDTYEVPAMTQTVLGWFGVQPETLVLVDDQLYNLTAPLGSTNVPAGLAEHGAVLFANPRYFGFTPAQYLSVAVFAAGIAAWFHIRDDEPMEWRQWEPEDQAEDGGD